MSDELRRIITKVKLDREPNPLNDQLSTGIEEFIKDLEDNWWVKKSKEKREVIRQIKESGDIDTRYKIFGDYLSGNKMFAGKLEISNEPEYENHRWYILWLASIIEE